MASLAVYQILPTVKVFPKQIQKTNVHAPNADIGTGTGKAFSSVGWIQQLCGPDKA